MSGITGQVWILISAVEDGKMRAINTAHIAQILQTGPDRNGERRATLQLADQDRTMLELCETLDEVVARILGKDTKGSFVAGAQQMASEYDRGDKVSETRNPLMGLYVVFSPYTDSPFASYSGQIMAVLDAEHILVDWFNALLGHHTYSQIVTLAQLRDAKLCPDKESYEHEFQTMCKQIEHRERLGEKRS